MGTKFAWYYIQNKTSTNYNTINFNIPKSSSRRSVFISGNGNRNNLFILLWIDHDGSLGCEIIYKGYSATTTFSSTVQDNIITLTVTGVPTWGTYTLAIF
jgi:hypothetical protein